ncbi:MAG: hypothetical protein AABW88_02440 [Nanoarchaeota archaeon]
MRSKRGVELALNIVVIAVIALLVLVIVVFIFGGKANIFSKGVSECTAIGGECSQTPCVGRPTFSNGECKVPEGEPKQYCCSNVITS